jgi:hypothetical protein
MPAQIDNRFIKLSLKKSFTRYLSYAFYEGRPLTTKGRWINPLVFSFYRLQAMLPFAKPVNKPIFILGTGRSGTTILGVTLGMHNAVGFLNEPKALWSYLYDSEDIIGSYQDKPGRYRLTAADASSSVIRKAHRIFGHYLRFGFASRVVDKYPELIFRLDFVKAIFPDAIFLFLYRDGRDTCHSIRHWSERLSTQEQGEMHDWWGRDDRKWNLLCEQIVSADDALGSNINEISSISNHEHRAAVEWIVTMKEGMKLMASHSDCVLAVKYEDFVRSPEFRRDVLKFCDLSPDGKFDQFCETVLKAPTSKPDFDLPPVIRDEFQRVMKKLGYE